VIRSNRSLHLPTSLALLTSAALTACVLASAPAQAQILYDTTNYTGGAPSSTAQAISIFDGLAGTTTSYGCNSVTTLDGVNNQNQFAGGTNSDIAYHESVVFTVSAGQVGTWSFRWGVDFGWGGTLLLDGVELQSRWTDMWWNDGFTDPTQYLAGSANLTAGTHILEVFGFEDCCDGTGNAQFLPPMSATWQDINSTNLAIAPAVCGSPAVLLTAGAAPSPVLDGGQLVYTFFYESTGTVAAAGATLSTAVPANTTFVSATGGGVNSSGTVSWTLGSLGVGVSGTVTLTVQVVSPLADGTTLTDTATLSATGASTASAKTNVTVSNALLSLTSASAPNPVAAGAQLTVTLGYANTGTGPAAAATITDLIPANTTFVSGSASGGGTYDATSHQVTFNLGPLAMGASGSVSYVVQVATPLANNTALTDMASFSATNNAAVSASSTANVSSAPSLTFNDAPSPNPVAADGMLVYTFGYANSGSDAAAGVTITEALPANVTFQTASAGGAYASTGNQVTWTIGSIAAGASGSVTVTVLVASPIANGTVLTDAASLAASNAATLMANSTVTVTSAPVLTLTETGAPNPVAAGAQLVYTLAYGNAGTDTAAAAAIVAPLPASTTFVSATGGGTYDSGANQVTFGLGSVAAGINGSVTFTVQIASPLANGTNLAASATMSATGVSSALAMATTTVDSAPTLSLTDTGTPNPILAGSQLTYTLAFANNGNDAAHGAGLSDVLPAGTSFISASNGGSYVAGTNTVSWTLSDLAAGGAGSVTLLVLVDGNTPAGMLSDTATLTASNGGAPITATAMTMVNSAATPDAGADAGSGTAGTGGGITGTGGSSATGTGGSSTGTGATTGTGGSSATGTGGAGGSSATGAGGAGGSSAIGTGGAGTTTGTGGAGTTTGTGGAGTTTGTGGAGTTTGSGGAGTTTGAGGAGGSSATGTGGGGTTTGTGGAGGTSLTGAGGASAGTGGAGGHATGGTSGSGGSGGNKGTGGAGGAAGGSTGGTSGGESNASSGCDCAVGTAASPTSLLGLVMVVGLLLVSRRRRPRR
jgi:uncharacterized repeat protein (TIGR01451 family)/MYXO-CTERM domain-containing protein